jgi:hypothetical protein
LPLRHYPASLTGPKRTYSFSCACLSATPINRPNSSRFFSNDLCARSYSFYKNSTRFAIARYSISTLLRSRRFCYSVCPIPMNSLWKRGNSVYYRIAYIIKLIPTPTHNPFRPSIQLNSLLPLSETSRKLRLHHLLRLLRVVLRSPLGFVELRVFAFNVYPQGGLGAVAVVAACGGALEALVHLAVVAAALLLPFAFRPHHVAKPCCAFLDRFLGTDSCPMCAKSCSSRRRVCRSCLASTTECSYRRLYSE